MTAQRISCPFNVWTKITTTSTTGVMILRNGGVILTESVALPTGDRITQPRSGELTYKSDESVYVDVNSGESVYALGLDPDGNEMDVTPKGGVL